MQEINNLMDKDLLDLITNFIKIPRIVSLSVDDVGKKIVFSARMTNTYQLYLLQLHELEGNTSPSPDQLTFKEDGVIHGYDLSSSGRLLVFPRDEGGSENYRVFMIDLETTPYEEVIITPQPLGRIDLKWFPDEKRVLVTGSDSENNFIKILDISSGTSDLIFVSDGWIDSSMGRNGKMVAVSTQRGSNVKNMDIVVFPVDDPLDQRIISMSDSSQETSPAWSNDGKMLAFITNSENKPRMILWDVTSEEIISEVLLPDEGSVFWPKSVTNALSSEVYLLIDHHGKERLYQYSIMNETLSEMFVSSRGSIHHASVANECLFIITSSFVEPPRLECYDLSTRSLLCSPYPKVSVAELFPNRPLIREIWYESFDKRKIHSWFVNPDPEGKSPILIKIHGGPTASIQNAWNPEIAILFALGFSIFLPNYRGSTGYGPEFRLLNLGDLGGGDYQDVIYGVKWLEKQGFLRNGKPSIIGGSYGGYMVVYSLVRSPDLWRCGVAAVPVTDWVADYELATADFRFFDIYFFGGTPDEKKELYVERSPITHVNNLKSPLLIIHGKNDSRCPYKPVKEFYEKTMALNKQVFLYDVDDEGHGAMKTENAINELFQEIRFLLNHHVND